MNSASEAIRSMYRRGGSRALLGDLYFDGLAIHWVNWGAPLRYTDPVIGGTVIYTPAPFGLADSAITKDIKETSVISVRLEVFGHDSNQNLSTRQKASLAETMAQLDLFLDQHDLRGALAVLRYVNPTNLTDCEHVFTGIVDRPMIDDTGITLEIAEPNDILGASCYPVSSTCPYVFCETRCGAVAAANKYEGTADSGTVSTIVDTAIPRTPAGKWDFSLVTMTSGLNNGLYRDVKTFNPDNYTLTLTAPFPYPVTGLDTFDLVRKCKKTFKHCQTMNPDNFKRFGGNPYVNDVVQGLFWRGKG